MMYKINEWIQKTGHVWQWLLVLLSAWIFSPAVAQAGILSKGVCRPYKQLVDNELYAVVALLVAVILVIVWKISPSGQIMARGVGLLAALAIGLNLENLLQTVAGVGVLC